jgi:hypothetical protein
MNSKENTTEKVSENVLEGNLHSYVYTWHIYVYIKCTSQILMS